MDTLRVLYNGDCPICSREIRHYRRIAEETGAGVIFEDLSEADLGRWGLDRDGAARRLYAMDAAGRRLEGIAAFLALWRRLPPLAWLARVLDRPVLRAAAEILYERVAAPLLYLMDRRRRA